jgi:hypothetical protein
VSRLQAAVLVLLAVPVLWALLWVGWRGRRRRQSGLAGLPPVPTDLGPLVFGPVDAVYVSSTSAGDWLDRVAVHGLGVRSAAQVGVHAGGVMVARQGAPDLWLSRGRLLGVRRQRGMAGKFVEADGLLVLTWTLGDDSTGGVPLDTGLRVRSDADRDALETAVAGLLAGPRSHHDGSHDDSHDDGSDDGSDDDGSDDGRAVEAHRG